MRLFSVAAMAALALLGDCVQSTAPTEEPGVVLSATGANQPGTNTGALAMAGIIIGGVAGAQVGQGVGEALAAAGGAVAGGIAGSNLEAAGQTHTGIAYTIRLADNRVVTIVEHLNPGDRIFVPGEAVRLQTSGQQQIVVPAD